MLSYWRKFTFYLIFGCAVFSCKKTDVPENPTLPVTETAIANKISIEIDTEVIIADGQSKPSITPVILDQSGKPLQDENWKLFANGTEVSGHIFTTTTPGNYQLQAKIGTIRSNIVEVVARENKNYEMVTLPVIIHIGHFGEAVGSGTNLGSDRVAAALENLNKLFANESGSTNPNAVDMRVRFRLATRGIDDNMLPETGIIRHNISNYDDGHSEAAYDDAGDKKLGSNESWKWQLETVWDPNLYLNIWVYPEQYGSSYAGFPRVYTGNSLIGLDEIAANCTDCLPDDNYLKSISITTEGFDGHSSTLAHEVGHALGLYHVFSTDNCQTSDYCPDSHSYLSGDLTPAGYCSDNKGWVGHDNIMDYRGSYQTFTYDQRERVRHVLSHAHWLSQLVVSDK